jgi:photosystem II stability/assembly factor-like uncharacterized protein
MNKKISQIVSVLALLVILSSLLVVAAPAQALYGQQQYQLQTLPGITNNVLGPNIDVTDFAIGSGVIYACSAEIAGAVAPVPARTGQSVYKSTDGGVSWTKATDIPGAIPVAHLAIAPDNANVVAVATATTVYISSDAGSTWTSLGIPLGGTTIMDVAVGPARSGTLLGREYAVALADTAAATVVLGDVMIIGGTNAWATAAAALPALDYMAVKFTPNFLGDRSLVCFGVTAFGAGGAQAFIVNTNTNTVSQTALITTTATIDFGGVANSAIKGTIALPADFDATTGTGRRAYIGWSTFGGAAADADVYRIDDNVAKALGAGTEVWSLAYAGTVSSGILFKGGKALDVRYSTDMTAGSPTWTATSKFMQPGAAAPKIMLATAPDYATSKKVFAGTSGVESAFSVSNNAGISFANISFIDMGAGAATVNTLTGVQMMISEKLTWMGTKSVNNNNNLWASTCPVSDVSWSRIWVTTPAAAASTAGPSLAPGFATNKVAYLIEDAAPITIYRTADGGETWNLRTAPAATIAIGGNIQQDDQIWWWVDATNTIYKTTNGGWTWSTGSTLPITGYRSSSVVKADNVIIGGTGAMAVTTDGGTTWTKYDLDVAERYRFARDPGFATNNIIYLADANAGGKVYKYVLGTNTKQDMIAPPVTGGGAANVGSIFIRGGVLYVLRGSAPAALQIERAVNFTDTPGTIDWCTMDANAPAVAGAVWSVMAVTDAGNNVLYVKDGNAGAAALYTYEDMMGAAKPVIKSPKTGFALSVDPTNGRGQQFTVVIGAMGSGSGMVTRYQIQVTDNASGWDAAVSSVAPHILAANPTAPAIVVNPTNIAGLTLLPNTPYLVRVRATEQVSGDTILSAWSDPIVVNVQSGGQVSQTQAGPIMTSPQGGATTSATPGFTWATVQGANKYQIVIATDAGMTKTVAGTPATVTTPSYQVTAPLAVGTYFWSVQATDPTVGVTSIGSFTVAAAAGTTNGTATVAPPQTIIVTQPAITFPSQAPVVVTVVPGATTAGATPGYIWAIIIIGAILVIAVIVLILRTRKTV